jgi:proliferating cell nuclear antigen
MPSSEFQRICRDLTILGDTVTIAASKEGIKFSVTGDLGSGNITVKQTPSVDGKVQATEHCDSCEFADKVVGWREYYDRSARACHSDVRASLPELFHKGTRSPSLCVHPSHLIQATPLSNTVILSMSPDVPLVVEYQIEELGWIRYYLAPKIEEDQ